MAPVRPPHRRRTRRALSAVALLAVAAGVVTACGEEKTGSPKAAASTGASTSAPASAGPADASTLHMIDSAGHRVAFHVTTGHGPTIVLDAGGGEDSSYWKELVPELRADTGATVITYDRAGLGRSEAVPGPWDAEAAAADLKKGLTDLGVTQDVLLVSHSQAGEVATYFAKENPKLVSGAVLVDANLPPFFTDQEIARLSAANQPQVDAAKKDPTTPENRQLLSTAENFTPAHRAFHEASWPTAVPARVIVSEKTPFDGSPEDARRWHEAAATFAQQAPNRTLVTAEGSSHDVPKDRPELVLAEIGKMAAVRG
ncbi:alpha/beta fold hydrolase [Streptomyces sp. NBC_00101]|uniref:alpha/beta fold hydrolase n=1 Tax=Streptomyces sp. NBC_00101 TaxID=2975651 RepID=UPI00324389A1